MFTVVFAFFFKSVLEKSVNVRTRAPTRTLLLIRCLPKGGGQSWGAWWGQRKVRETGKSPGPGCRCPSHRDAAGSEIRLFSFDPGNNAPAGGPRTCPLPMCPYPKSRRYHQPVPVWIRALLIPLPIINISTTWLKRKESSSHEIWLSGFFSRFIIRMQSESWICFFVLKTKVAESV